MFFIKSNEKHRYLTKGIDINFLRRQIYIDVMITGCPTLIANISKNMENKKHFRTKKLYQKI